MNALSPGDEGTGMLFPCEIDVKVFMRTRSDNTVILQQLITAELQQEQLLFIKTKKSSAGRYQSLSCRVKANSREEIDSVFRKLTAHTDILMVI